MTAIGIAAAVALGLWLVHSERVWASRARADTAHLAQTGGPVCACPQCVMPAHSDPALVHVVGDDGMCDECRDNGCAPARADR